MRITTRTPPVRIAASDMLAISRLAPLHAGLVLRWGMRRYAEGVGVPIEEARAEAGMDDRDWSLLVLSAASLIDPDALAGGVIVVAPFADAADHLAKVSSSKVRAARAVDVAARIASGAGAARTATPGAASSSDAMAATGAAPPTGGGEPTAPPVDLSAEPAPELVAPSPVPRPVEPGPWDGVAGTLVARGAAPSEVTEAVSRWRLVHQVDEVVEQIHAMNGRRVAKPVRYLDAMLQSLRAAQRQAMPPEIAASASGPLLPRGVRRTIRVGPRAGWSFEGWTAKGHPRGGEELADRREVWRNDSGTLTYTQPAPDKTVPTYEEDPGVYETD